MPRKDATGTDWGSTSDWVPTGIPVANDETFFGESSQSMTGTMDQGTIDLDLIYTHPLFENDVGASGGPLKIAADLIVLKGRGNFYMECSAGGAALKTDEVRIEAANAAAIIELDSESGDAGDFDKIVVKRGNVTLGADIEFGASCAVDVAHVVNPASDAHVTITEGADTLATLNVRGGVVLSNGAVTAANIYAGKVTQDKAAMTTVNVYGGELVYNHSSLGSGGYIEVWPGAVLDIMQGVEAKTLAIKRHEGSIVKPYDSSLHTITETWL